MDKWIFKLFKNDKLASTIICNCCRKRSFCSYEMLCVDEDEQHGPSARCKEYGEDPGWSGDDDISARMLAMSTMQDKEGEVLPGLLKKIIIKEDCIFFLSHADDVYLEILKPVPVTRISKFMIKYSKQNPYLSTSSFVDFIQKSIKAIPDLERRMKKEVG